MSLIREVYSGGWCVRFDLASQRLHIDLPEYDWGRWRDRANGRSLSPALPTDGSSAVSAATLLFKAKQFDDGLYAAVEVAAQCGLGQFKGKAFVLRSLAEHLESSGEAATLIHAACRLGGITAADPAGAEQGIVDLVQPFLANDVRSKPLGFYTWNSELTAIFRQDRLLQTPLKDQPANELLTGLNRSRDALETYKLWLRLNDRLTNPRVAPSLDAASTDRSFAPPSRSHEQVLLEKLYGDQSIPEGFELLSELIARVRSGEINLEPREASGWYDVQTWALGSLLVANELPEANRIVFGEHYCNHLEELFRGALAHTRETHVKQLAIAMAGSGLRREPTIFVSPGLGVEPLPTLYARRAASYRFVRAVLAEIFGTDALSRIHRLSEEAPSSQNLADELAAMESLFDGAAAQARADLGIEPEPNDAKSIGRFIEWSKNRGADPHLACDPRMMVPVYYDQQRRQIKVWAFLGWQSVPADVKYLANPSVSSIENSEPPASEPPDRLGILKQKFRKPSEQPATAPPRVLFRGDSHRFAEPVVAEVLVSKLLDRDEFRRYCDRHKTKDAILANLQ